MEIPRCGYENCGQEPGAYVHSFHHSFRPIKVEGDGEEISAEAEQEAERRYPETQPYYKNRRLVSPDVSALREAFRDGVAWQAER